HDEGCGDDERAAKKTSHGSSRVTPGLAPLPGGLAVQALVYAVVTFVSRPKRRAARARDEAGLDQQRHDLAVADGLAVEALDRQALDPRRLCLPHQRRQRSAELSPRGPTERHERPAAALHEERRLAADQHDVRSRYARGPRARSL